MIHDCAGTAGLRWAGDGSFEPQAKRENNELNAFASANEKGGLNGVDNV